MTVTALPSLNETDAALYAAIRLRAARLQPYFASAIFSLVPIPAPTSGSFGVDSRWRVYVDMDQARLWGIEKAAGVLLHEAHHVVRGHHHRAAAAGVTPDTWRLWNLATDAAINDDLAAAGIPLPDPVLPGSFGLVDGGLEEAYFTHLCAERARQNAGCHCGSGSGGTPLSIELTDDISGVDEVDAAATRREVAHHVVAAVGSSHAPSPQLSRWAESLLNPKVPWRSLLRGAFGRSVRTTAGVGVPTWSRPDRRSDCRGEFMQPGQQQRRPVVAVVIDTSASMSKDLLNQAITELNSLITKVGCATITVVVCDQQASPPQVVRRISQLHLSGGGNTDLRVGIRAAGELRPRPDVIAVITDGYTLWPPNAPDKTRLVAVVINDRVALPTGAGIVAVRIDEP